jgi:hypothetical protein
MAKDFVLLPTCRAVAVQGLSKISAKILCTNSFEMSKSRLVKTPTYTIEMQAKVAARHETCNQRFKMWGIQQNDFRIKGIDLWGKHGRVFDAIAVITQLSFYIYKPLARVEYDDRDSCLRQS